MSKRNSRAAKARRRANRIFDAAAGDGRETGFGRFGFDLPAPVVAELDAMSEHGDLAEGFTVGFGEASEGFPPDVAEMRHIRPGWYWRCGRSGCPGGETIGSAELIAALGACTGS